MPNVSFVTLTRHGDAEIEIDGQPYGVQITAQGVQLSPLRANVGPVRVVPWQTLTEMPAAYGVVADGWLLPKSYATEVEALDKATDLRTAGARAEVIRLAKSL